LLTLLIPTGALGGPVAALLRPFATSWRLATVPEAAGVSGRGAGGEIGTPDAPATAAVGTGLMDPAAARRARRRVQAGSTAVLAAAGAGR
jgi:hypothetical protein